MNKRNSHSDNDVLIADPSTIRQHFPHIPVDILCCRLWWLKNWEHGRLSFPFWRIYYNFNTGGVMEYQGKEISMTPDTIFLIAPNTNYKSRIAEHDIPQNGRRLVGGDMYQRRDIGIPAGAVEHLFIHFKLNSVYDSAFQGIFAFSLEEHTSAMMYELKTYLLTDKFYSSRFDMRSYWLTQSLVCELLRRIDRQMWHSAVIDSRMMRCMQYIDANYAQALSNKLLAGVAYMATNSFARLFKKQMGVTVQNYIKKKRIDHACCLLIRSSLKMEEVAFRTGFANRFHFTRSFCEVTGISPAAYKKLFIWEPGLASEDE